MSENVLLISVEMLQERTALHDNVEPKIILPEIKAAQDLYIMPLCGTALFNRLIKEISDTGTLTEQYKELNDLFLLDVLCNHVLAELYTSISYQIWNKGVATKSDNSTPPTLQDLYGISTKYKRRAEAYEERARTWLLRKAGEGKFPEYINPGNGVDTVIPENNSMYGGLYLGDCDEPQRSYAEKYQGNIYRR
jgi:hypothetical protein